MIINSINCEEYLMRGAVGSGKISAFRPVYYYTRSIRKEGDSYFLHQKPFDMSPYRPLVEPEGDELLVTV
jgi:hypothetical protein